MSPLDRLAQLERENARLREELAEWRQWESEGLHRALEEDRLGQMKLALGLSRIAATMLAGLLDASPRVLGNEALINLRPRSMRRVDEIQFKAADVYVCKIRAAFRVAGAPFDPIRTVWALGYVITPERKAQIERFLAEARL